ncbi:MAG: DUF2834 domain-containing protein [Cyanobacteria bacterium P01_A01_bin.37]
MNRSAVFWAIWLSFIGYAFVFAPPDQPDTFPLIQRLSTGQWDDINPLIVGLFNIMGIWPLIYGALMVTDGYGQRVMAWPFAIASFALGAFAVLPYLALRQPNPTGIDQPNQLVRIVNSRWFGGAIALGAVGFFAYGLMAGDWGEFAEQWQQSRFIHVMSLDFCMLCVLVGSLLGDDMARRGLGDRRIFWAVILIPLFGIVAYLCLRPPLSAQSEPISTPV